MDTSDLNPLLRRTGEGDSQAFAQLYEELRRPVFAVAYAVTHDRFLAEDVLQDTFVTVREKSRLYSRQDNPKAWVLSIAHNLAVDMVRRRRRELPQEFDDEIYAGQERGFESRVIDDALLEQAFRVLSDEERQIVVLHLVTGCRHRETARILQLPLGTVLWKYRASLKKLQEALPAHGPQAEAAD